MGVMLLKKIGLLFLLISAALLSSSFAGRQTRFASNAEKEAGAVHEEAADQEEVMTKIHERLLRANTKDYGRYDPSPALVKPPFKLIPN